ncbi:MAG: vWA domain-containing protein [Nanoarchaeota archaeon]
MAKPVRPLWKKGFYFTLDATFAAILLITGLLLLSKFYVHENPSAQADTITQDLLNTLNDISLDNVHTAFIEEEIANGNITSLNASVLLKIGEYWATNQTEKAENLSQLLVENLIPPQYGASITIGSDIIYTKERNVTTGTPRDIITSKRMISGIAKGSPLKGSSSAAYLKKIRNKRTASYIYFGGFEGQGNLTKYLEDLPSDVGPEDIKEIILVLDVPSAFDFYINGIYCGTFTPTTPAMVPDLFNATGCNASIIPGRNTFSFNFSTELNLSYIAGGFLKMTYITDEFQHNETYGQFKYYFPGIDGLINIYSSIYVPGTINSYKANLTYFNNYTTFLTIGNETIFNETGQNTTQTVYRERSGLDWPTSTIPLRLGILNINREINQSTGEPADIIFVSDVSGSMDACVLWRQPQWWCEYECRQTRYSPYQDFACSIPDDDDCDNQHRPCGGIGWNKCRNFDIICEARKIDLMKIAENNSVDIFLNVTGTRVGLVSYSTSTVNTLGLTTDKGTLHSRINSYTPNGYTCISCGILSARQMYPHESKEFMIVISDGDANRNTTGGSGRAMAEAIEMGQAACAEGITVYTIGFGEDISQQGTDTLIATACNSSLYYNATNVTELYDIVKNITEQIIILSNYTQQTLEVKGNFTRTNLSPDSFVEINYTPYADALNPNEITVQFSSDQFADCNPSIPIHDGIRILDAKIASYSGSHWTDGVIANSQEVFNLSFFSTDYYTVGDPFIVEIPTTALVLGAYNNLSLRTGDSMGNSTNCSLNNSFIYLASVNSSTTRTDVLEFANGCNWTIEFEDGTFLYNASIPLDYTGDKLCNYTNASIAYNATDAYDLSVYNILHDLDFDEDGRVIVNLNAEDLEIVVTLVSSVPYLWGPSFIEVTVWR